MIIPIINNGHTIETIGKESYFADGTTLKEYIFNRRVTAEIFKMLEKEGYPYIDIVPETEGFPNDYAYFNMIAYREKKHYLEIKKSGNKPFYISVHGNAFNQSELPNGIETYYWTQQENASIFQKHLINETGMENRGVKKAGFFEIKQTLSPAILTENGFYTNYDNCRYMLSTEGVKAIAYAHFLGIKELNEKYS